MKHSMFWAAVDIAFCLMNTGFALAARTRGEVLISGGIALVFVLLAWSELRAG